MTRAALPKDPRQWKVAIVTRNAVHGGVETVIEIQRRVFNATVIVAGGLDSSETCPFPYVRAENHAELADRIRDHDFILYHWVPDWAVDSIADSGIPSIEFVHRADTAESDKEAPSVLVTHSNFLARYLREKTGRECHLLPLPVDPKRFRPVETPGHLIGGPTSYVEKKGLEVFLNAWREVRSEFPKWRVRFYGSGSAKTELEELARRLGIEADFFPPIARPETIYHEFGCIVIPSRIEGLPLVLLEALAQNLPVIATDLPGIREFNETARSRGKNELIPTFESENVNQCQKVLRRVLNAKRPETRAYVDSHYGLDAHVLKLTDLFLEAHRVGGWRSHPLSPSNEDPASFRRGPEHCDFLNNTLELADLSTNTSASLLKSLEVFREHWSTRLCRRLEILEQNLIHGSWKSRLQLLGQIYSKLIRGKPVQASASPTNAFILRAGEELRRLEKQGRSLTLKGASPKFETLPDPEARSPRLRDLRAHSKRKVAILTNMLLTLDGARPSIGGGERYALTLAKLLSDVGLEVHFFQASRLPFLRNYLGFPVTGLGAEPGPHYGSFLHGLCTQFTRLSRDFDHVFHNLPEMSSGEIRDDALVICHGLWFDHECFGIDRFHGHEWHAHLRRAFSVPQRVVSVDLNSINFIRATWPNLAQKMKYIPNFFDPTLFYPSPRKSSERLTVLFPRRATHPRGARLMEVILKEIPHQIALQWVGTGDPYENESLHRLAEKDPRFTFLAMDFTRIADVYRSADITVIPTIGGEGTSLSCLEALACGNAVVATQVGGLCDLIQDEVNGLLVEPTAEAIARGINRLVESPEERVALSQAGIASAQRFELSRWQRRWCEVLLELGWIAENSLPASLKTLSHRSQSPPPYLQGRPPLLPTEPRLH